jgi:hypothetical protein
MDAAITGVSRAAGVVSGAAIVACAPAQANAVACQVNVTARRDNNTPYESIRACRWRRSGTPMTWWPH